MLKGKRQREKKDVVMLAFYEHKIGLAQVRAQLKDLGYEQWEIDLFIDGDADPENYK